MDGQLWIEPIGSIIVARIRGIPDQALLNEMQEKIVLLVNETGRCNVLYDALEMEAPPIEIPLWQQKLDKKEGTPKFRRAILVPNTKLAYLARIAFGDGDYRVFYSDLAAAVTWLAPSNGGYGARFSDAPPPLL